MRLLRFLALVCMLLVVGACQKVMINPIPSARVSIPIDVYYTDMELEPVLGIKSYTQKRYETDYLGFGGVVVIHGYDGASTMGEYALYAFDLACPNEVLPTVRVEPHSDGTATCPTCKTVYDMTWGFGNPLSGPSKYALRRYSIIPRGSGEYEVRN